MRGRGPSRAGFVQLWSRNITKQRGRYIRFYAISPLLGKQNCHIEALCRELLVGRYSLPLCLRLFSFYSTRCIDDLDLSQGHIVAHICSLSCISSPDKKGFSSALTFETDLLVVLPLARVEISFTVHHFSKYQNDVGEMKNQKSQCGQENRNFALAESQN